MKIKVIESMTDAPGKQEIYIWDKAHRKIVLILKVTPEELLQLAEGKDGK